MTDTRDTLPTREEWRAIRKCVAKGDYAFPNRLIEIIDAYGSAVREMETVCNKESTWVDIGKRLDKLRSLADRFERKP